MYYKAGDDVNGVRMYDLQFLSPEKMPGKVDKDTVVKGMQDFVTITITITITGKHICVYACMHVQRTSAARPTHSSTTTR